MWTGGIWYFEVFRDKDFADDIDIAERISDITYPVSSSPYYSEDIHTKITLWYYSKESWPKDNLD
jgi:hypothetical protein